MGILRKKTAAAVLPLLASLGLLSGCGSFAPAAGDREPIPFGEGQYYAAAYLGYQETGDLDYYVERYLDGGELPVHYLSGGDYYLIIPRYDGMELALYRNELETSQPVLIYEDPACRPFLLQCNVSDIFPDATICLTYGEEKVEFSPFLSLKDGSVDIGDQGLDLTRDPTAPAD